MASKTKQRKAKKSLGDYLKSATNNAALVPSLKKYKRRKQLKPQEKAAITRAAKNIAKVSRGATLVPLTKSQVKALGPGKAAMPGRGIRAIGLRSGVIKDAKISVRKGQVLVRQKGKKHKRIWHFIPTAPDINDIEPVLKKWFRSGKGQVSAHPYTTMGHVQEGYPTLAQAIAGFAEFITRYSLADPTGFAKWFEGVAILEQIA